LKLTTDRREASRGLFATVELLVYFSVTIISKTAKPIFAKSYRKMSKLAAIEKLSFWSLNSFRVGGRFENVTFSALPSPNWTQFHEIEYGDKTNLLIEKEAV